MVVKNNDLDVIGWREWIALPDFGVTQVKCKVDTGAKTSALHTYFIEPFKKSEIKYVRFGLHPIQNNSDTEVICISKVHDQREVTDSGGHREMRYVIATPIKLGPHILQAEITLTNRENMLFRMLLGRDAIKNQFIVNPARSYLIGKKKR
ncbi:MAG: ATP-dependent zinc protease [Gammaproteobacteria bacterium]